MVAKRIEKKNPSYIDGLMELSDLWIELEFPNDSPHIFQGRENNITPQEYYTKQNYDKLFSKHKEWLKNEINYVLSNQS